MMMKNIILCLTIAGAGLLVSGCNNWLDVLPNNEQVAADYWQTKEQVEEILAQGYSEMRTTVPSLIYWGELRGGSVYAYQDTKMQDLQNFQIMPSSSLCKWGPFYNLLNVANSVIKYASDVKAKDETYKEAVMHSNMAEAYFMRAWTYFTLVRNFKEVPLILEPYMTDDYAVSLPKSSEESIIALIKSDIETALSTGAAKEFYDDDNWAGMTKGRITKWALCALMADVCLWSEDYEGCIKYADMLLNSTSAYRPAFMEDPTQWFSIFYPGNSNESVFEINFDDKTYQQTANSPSTVYPWGISPIAKFQYSKAMCQRLHQEYTNYPTSIRTYLGAYKSADNTTSIEGYCIWKFQGSGYMLEGDRSTKDANWILYRMADILLMKAEALIWQGGDANYAAALELINKVRTRAQINILDDDVKSDEERMLKALLEERDLEFAAEGKRWYDLVRFGKSKNYKYKTQFIDMITANNSSITSKWLRSVLKNNYAWYLPIHQDEIDRNPVLSQNPYYDVTVN